MERGVVDEQVPSGYPICTPGNCSEHTHCLHARFASQVLGGEHTFTLISSHHPQYQEGKACELYRSSSPGRYARGLARTMGEVSHNNYVASTDYLIAKHAKAQFYHIKRDDIPLLPAEQAKLQALLRTYGCTDKEPLDNYKTRYIWY